MINVDIKNNLPKLTGSLKTIIPIRTVPTVPIPLQMLYAVPSGKVLITFDMRNILKVMAATAPTPHIPFSIPIALLALPKQKVKTSSIHPDRIKRNQFIIIFIFLVAKFIIPTLFLFYKG